jgi:hypothetical protein
LENKMKISQARLKEIIREELQTHIQEQEVMARSGGVGKVIVRTIKAAVDIWLEPLEASEISSYPFETWVSLVNTINAQWDRVSRNYHGYGNPACETEECARFAAIFAKRAEEVDGVWNELNDALNEENGSKKWLAKRGNGRRLRRAVKNYMDYIPPGSPDDLPKSIEQSKVWLTTTPESGDDL